MKNSLLLTGALLLTAPLLPAATISWSVPQNITGDADVSTLGTTVVALNVGGTATTVNGVTFATYSGSGSGVSDTLNNNPGTVFGNAAAPNSSLTASYQALVNSGRYSDFATPETMTLTGLSIGQTYQVQFWSNDSRPIGSGRTLQITAGTSAVLDYNMQNAAGGLGQYVLGTFTADATTQVFDLLGGHNSGTTDSTQLNGFQLRAIPEPSQAVLALLGIMPLLVRRRR